MQGKWISRSGLLLVLLTNSLSSPRAMAIEVDIPDPSLRETVRFMLRLPEGQPITDVDMLQLDSLLAVGGDLRGLEYATNMRELRVDDDIAPLDLAPLTGLTALEKLSISAPSGAYNTTAIGGLTGLRSLVLGGFPLADADMQMIGGLSGLENLSFARAQIPGIIRLAGLTQLRSFGLYGAPLEQLDQVRQFSSLEHLSLCDMGLTDISPLSQMSGLQFLDLSWNSVNDLSPIAALVNLEDLILAGNGIEDLDALSDVTQLAYLSLADNQISDLSPLAGMSDLHSLDLKWNNISDLLPLGNMVNLWSVNLRHNHIEDIKPLTTARISIRLELEENPLGLAAYEEDIPTLLSNNPDLIVCYDPAPEPSGFLLISIGLVAFGTRRGRSQRLTKVKSTSGVAMIWASRAKRVVVVVVCILLGPAILLGGDYQWKYASDGLWHSVSNWTKSGGGTGYPQSGDYATISQGTPRVQSTSCICKSISISGTGALRVWYSSQLEVESGSGGLCIGTSGGGQASCTIGVVGYGSRLITRERTVVGDVNTSVGTFTNDGGNHSILAGTYNDGDLTVGNGTSSTGTYILSHADNMPNMYELDVAGTECIGYRNPGTLPMFSR